MSRFIKYNDTKQFRDINSHVRNWSNHHGAKPPKLIFTGTVKLHGTNASVIFGGEQCETHYVQSRNRILVPGSDNAGFATFVEGTALEELRAIALRVRKDHPGTTPIQIFGEWAGPGVQPGDTAIQSIPYKMFFIFAIRVAEGHEEHEWIRPTPYMTEEQDLFAEDEKQRVRNLEGMSWSVDIDFNAPGEAVNWITELVTKVENECPVGATLCRNWGIDPRTLLGEGLVWRCIGYVDANGDRHYVDEYNHNGSTYDLRQLFFKTKGEKHSVTKVKVLVPVDLEKQKCLEDFIEYAVTENRMRQGLVELASTGKELKRENTGDFVRWVYNDVVKEELDVMVASNLEVKQIGGALAQKAKVFYLNEVEAAVAA